jgi:hypothetical protein
MNPGGAVAVKRDSWRPWRFGTMKDKGRQDRAKRSKPQVVFRLFWDGGMASNGFVEVVKKGEVYYYKDDHTGETDGPYGSLQEVFAQHEVLTHPNNTTQSIDCPLMSPQEVVSLLNTEYMDVESGYVITINNEDWVYDCENGLSRQVRTD